MRPIIFAPLLGLCLTAGLSLPAKAQYQAPSTCGYFLEDDYNTFYTFAGLWCLESKSFPDFSGGTVHSVSATIATNTGYELYISKYENYQTRGWNYIISVKDYPDTLFQFRTDFMGEIIEESIEGNVYAVDDYMPAISEGLLLIRNIPLGSTTNPF